MSSSSNLPGATASEAPSPVVVERNRLQFQADLRGEVLRGRCVGLAYCMPLMPESALHFVPIVAGDSVQPGGTLTAVSGSLPVPPDSNTGGNFGKGATGEPVHVDALTFTIPGLHLDYDLGHARSWVERWSDGLFTVGGPLVQRYNGYSQCYEIVFADCGHSEGMKLGWVGISYASDAMRGRWCFCFHGVATCMIRDFVHLVADAGIMGGRITRVDLALDDLEGKHPIMGVYRQWKAGDFGTGGRQPKCKTIFNSDGSGDTLYIGSRDSGKLARHYEKGKQLGDKSSIWVRHEVEFLAKDRVLPWDMLLHPAEYLKGAYPVAYQWMQGVFFYLKVAKRKAGIVLGCLLEHGRQQVGALINYCRDKLGLSSDEVLEVMKGKPGRYPRLLVESIKLDSVIDAAWDSFSSDEIVECPF